MLTATVQVVSSASLVAGVAWLTVLLDGVLWAVGYTYSGKDLPWAYRPDTSIRIEYTKDQGFLRVHEIFPLTPVQN